MQTFNIKNTSAIRIFVSIQTAGSRVAAAPRPLLRRCPRCSRCLNYSDHPRTLFLLFCFLLFFNLFTFNFFSVIRNTKRGARASPAGPGRSAPAQRHRSQPRPAPTRPRSRPERRSGRGSSTKLHPQGPGSAHGGFARPTRLGLHLTRHSKSSSITFPRLPFRTWLNPMSLLHRLKILKKEPKTNPNNQTTNPTTKEKLQLLDMSIKPARQQRLMSLLSYG